MNSQQQRERCNHKTKKGNQCANQANHIYNTKALCNLHLDYVKSTEDCPICMFPMTTDDRIQLTTCKHYYHKTCLAKCVLSQCPTCRIPISSADNVEIHKKTIFEPLAFLTFSQPKDVQASIITSFSTIFGQHRDRNPSQFSMIEWAIKILSHSFDYGVPLDVVITLLNMNSAAVQYYTNNRTLQGFQPNLDPTII